MNSFKINDNLNIRDNNEGKMAKAFLSFLRKTPLYKQHHYLLCLKPVFKLNHGIMITSNISRTHINQRCYSSKVDNEHEKSVGLETRKTSELSEEVQPTTFKTVKEATKTASYMGIILIGVGVTSLLFYSIFSELFSSKSPNNVYSKTLEKVISDVRVKDALGEPITGYGEENRRGRRQHARHLLYEKDGEKRLRMKFYICGTRKRATVHLEMKEDEGGNYVYRYLFVELDDFGRHPIMFEDNRHSSPQAKPGDNFSSSLDLQDIELK